MATKPVKETIGLIKCPMKGHNAEVRKQINGILYFQCKCGKITPSREEGQRWIFDNCKMFSEEQKNAFNNYPRVGGLSVYVDEIGEEPVYDPKQEKEVDPVKAEPTHKPTNPLDPGDDDEPEPVPPGKPEEERDTWSPGFI